MPEKTIKRRQQDTRNAAIALDRDTVLLIVAKLVEALNRSIPEGTRNAELKNEACASRVNCSAEPNTRRRKTERTSSPGEPRFSLRPTAASPAFVYQPTI
jgi:hypothetical protein